MTSADPVDRYLETMVAEKIYGDRARLKFYLDSLFRNVSFTDKVFLDIGGGVGLFSFYAAAKGARRVLCLEPEFEGSRSAVTEKFEAAKQSLGYENVELRKIPFQALDPTAEKFDIVFLHNSINHLDEEACIHLLSDTRHQTTYRNLFAKLFAISNHGARLIVCDCSRYNFFPMLGLKNPFARSIEWHKHQAPEVWAQLLKDVGFTDPKIRWSSFNSLGNLGRLFRNKPMAFFFHSHFCLTMTKP